MKRIFFLLLLLGAQSASTILFAATSRPERGPIAPVSEDYIKVYINKIENTVGTCEINGLSVPADRPRSIKLLIPFISIGTYTKQYRDAEPYTPKGAIGVLTPYGHYRLWASESGVMYAPDPENKTVSHDNWKAKKLLGITRDEHGGKKLYLASLVLALKDSSKKFKMSLEPLR